MNKKDYFYYFTLFFLIIILFLILTPKLSIKIFPFLKKNKFNEFNRYLLTIKDFNPQRFWEFREFFCPGYFSVNKNGFKDINLEKYIFLNKKQEELTTFALYNCFYFKSFENLTEENRLDFLLNIDLVEKKYKIISKNKEFIYFKEKNKETYYLIFLVDNKKMQNAVGFFDYKEKDKNSTENKNWFGFTIFSL